MSASQVLNASTYYTTLVANDALPDPTFCNQCKSWKPMTFHKCRSRTIFGGAKDCAQISRNLPEKRLKRWPQKWLHFFPFWAYFFKSKHFRHHFCPIFPQTCPNVP